MKRFGSLLTVAALGLCVLSIPAKAETLRRFDTKLQSDGGGSFRLFQSKFAGFGNAAMVNITAWEFNYKSKDHHIDKISLRVENLVYNRFNGFVTFDLAGNYQDKNFDDDYTWRVEYDVLVID